MKASSSNWENCRSRHFISMEDGFTLLEVIVSMAVTLVLIGGLLNLLMLGTSNVSQGGGRTTACIYASSLLEEMKARPELWAEVAGAGTVRADSLAFLQSHPAGVEAEISLKPLEGVRGLYIVNIKVLTTGGNIQWEECLVGVVPAP